MIYYHEFLMDFRLKNYLWFFQFLYRAVDMSTKLRLVGSVVCVLIAKFFFSLSPTIYGRIIDSVSNGSVLTFAIPLSLIGAYVLVRVQAILFEALQEKLFSQVYEHLSCTLGVEAFKHIHRLPYAVHLEQKPGSISEKISKGLYALQTLLYTVLIGILPMLFQFLFIFGVFIYFFPLTFALILIAGFLLYIAVSVWFHRSYVKVLRELNTSENDVHAHLVETVINFEPIRYLNTYDFEKERFQDAWESRKQLANRAGTRMAFYRFVQNTILCGLLGLFLVMLSMMYRDQSITVGQFAMVIAYLLQLINPVQMFAYAFNQIGRSLIRLSGLMELFALDVESDDSTAPALTVSGGTIVFDHVSFGYPGKDLLLNEITVTIAPGSVVGIVGATGAGKTTLVRLLLRFYEPSHGRICIDGTDIATVRRTSLRDHIGIVPQDIALFNNTILYNLTYGLEIPFDEVVAVTTSMQLHDFITSLPEGYSTMVGERGIKLSGGEKQRLSIARMLLRKPSILLLDEATSSLDMNTEKTILEHLEHAREGRTSIVIAHRLSTIKHADQIIVFENGTVKEIGTHSQLMKSEGTYFALWQQAQVDHRKGKKGRAVAV